MVLLNAYKPIKFSIKLDVMKDKGLVIDDKNQ